ncbi:MAG TPA: hypothetical protein VFN51_01845 [Candidatus Saccharimonadales bacterium]|nr:hypothetical protein [Candidatus Saccharimonadales bacterium]
MAQGIDGKNLGELIEDVYSPVAHGFDYKQTHVKRQPIGRLQQQYIMSRADFVRTDDFPAHLSGGNNITPVNSMTRIPPLSTLNFNYDTRAVSQLGRQTFTKASALAVMLTRIFRNRIRFTYKTLTSQVSGRSAALYALLAAALASLTRIRPAWLPKRYTLERGLIADLKTRPFTLLKTVVPLGILLIGLSWFIFSSYTLHDGPANVPHGRHAPSRSASSSAANNNMTANEGGANSKKVASATAATPSPTDNSLSFNSSSSGGYSSAASSSLIQGTGYYPSGGVSTSPSGGYGGGTVPVSTSGSSPTPIATTSPTLPYTVNVPSAGSSIDGKNIISTTGTGITLN